MRKLTFKVSIDKESGGFVASWDDPVHCGGITTQADSLGALENEILDAVRCYFDSEELPISVRAHFEEDPTLPILEPA